MSHSIQRLYPSQKSRRWCLAAIAWLLISAFSAAAPPAPDYTQLSAWAAHPEKPGTANETPAGVSEKSQTGVDVFFVHPTTYLSPTVGSAAFDAESLVGAGIDSTMKFQASAFNGCCRIYAPRYRQASLRAIGSHTRDAYAAADLAYGDVQRAFDTFVANLKGHPFIVASHSQGSIHALRLLQQRVIGTPLQQKLVAAYLIGAAMPQDITQLGIPICDTPDRTGCVLTWNSTNSASDRSRLDDSVLWWQGKYQPMAKRQQVCVNPLDWRIDSAAAATANLGSIYSEGRNDPLAAPVVGQVSAHCENGMLVVDIAQAQRKNFRDVLTLFGSYHDFDYRLFYMNIRANAIARSGAWQAVHQ